MQTPDTCRNCQGPHDIQRCPELLAALLAPFRPEEMPEDRLRASLHAAALALACRDCQRQGLPICAMCAVWAGEKIAA